MYKELTLGEITIHRNDNDLYSLNDLHKAAGGEQRHQPSNFMRLDSTLGLIEELGCLDLNNADSDLRNAHADLRNAFFIKQGGINQGTFVCKELVYAYAMWISPAFHILVIRGYDKWFHDPGIIRITGEKKPSLSKMIELGRTIEKMGRLVVKTAKTNDPYVRAQYLAMIKTYCDETGTECIDPALIGTRTVNDPPVVVQFWDTFESINSGQQHLFNHSCSPDQEIALKLSQIYGHCQTQGISFPEHNILRPLLLKSERYRYASTTAIWSRIWRKTTRCMIFTKN